MKWNWNELFGNDYYIEIKNSERKYFGLNEIASNWEKSEFYSKTNICYKKTVVFWKKDTIKKVIVEENCMTDDGMVHSRYYQEFDTVIETENREMILPLTTRGRKKKVSATNILAITPFGCQFYFSLESISEKPRACIHVCNPRNNQKLAIGEEKRISKIVTSEDFRMFIEAYISTCPDDYFDRIERMRTKEHKTVKYQPGDIFRVEMDRFHYCYGLITGEVKKIQKWPELPERHSMRSFMMVPLMIRFFEFVTSDGKLKAADLQDIPLGRVYICGDNDIIWGTHPIVDHKNLEVSDVEFHLICTKYFNEDKHSTVFTQDFLLRENRIAVPKEYNLYIEWGTATARLAYSQLSDKLKEYLANYHSPHGGVFVSIYPDTLLLSEEEKRNTYTYRYDLMENHNQGLRKELFSCLGLDKNADFDDFAAKFGGLKKSEILEKIIT
ncbi:MAG: immunity 26/phosphotriesterase HocA family protein [Lachnospiraceae bacterium]|nr:immunity 26/phosphotriesterase HocA family protein [Lachnospiraceae bacterium]